MDGFVTVGAAALAILQKEAAQFERLGGKVLQSQDSEAIHQMRVAARRMRAALKCFEDYLPKSTLKIDSDLRWTFHALGAVRDSDVLIKDVLGTCPETAARKHLVEVLRAKRLEAWDLLAATLRSKRYASLIDSLKQVRSQGALARKSRKLAVEVAPGLIGDQKDQVWRLARRLGARMSSAEVHELRKRAKRFRYTLEFFAEPYGNRSRRMLKSLKNLQDQLGAFVDASFAGRAMKDLLREERTEGQVKALVKDLIEAYGEKRERALEELSEERRDLSVPWRKLKRKMAKLKKEARKRPFAEGPVARLRIISSR